LLDSLFVKRIDRSLDEISVVEAAYRLDGSETSWLDGLATVAVTLLDEGWGVTASTWRTGLDTIELRAVAASGGPPGFGDAVTDTLRNASPAIQGRALSGQAAVTTLSANGAADLVPDDPGSRELVRLGIRDCLMVRGADAGGYHVVLSAYLPQPTRPLRQSVSRWNRIARHLAAGFRVRRALHGLEDARRWPDPRLGSEAILTPNGSLEHAEAPAKKARQALAEAVLGVESARSRLRRSDPDAALEAWKGLVAGRWSLVDHVDADGKRFLVARKNDPDAPEVPGLTLRERQVMAARARGLSFKLIAYDLGLSMTTVARSLQHGMAKLGVPSDTELPALFCPGERGS
jgi:DNA-binding CsgD family transcriptional regulator